MRIRPGRERIVRGTGSYAAAAVLQRGTALLLLPLLARVLSPSEYGQIALIATVAAAFGTVVGLGLETAVLRGYVRLSGDGDAARIFVNTVGGFAIVVPIAAGVLLAGALVWLPPAFDIEPTTLAVAVLSTALGASTTLVPLALLRAQERFSDYFRLSATQILVSTGLTILFVVVLRWGVLGWALASLGSSAVLLVRGLLILRHRWSMDFSAEPLRRALAFGIPMVPHALAHWGLAVSDRAILGSAVPASDIGAYYVAYQACLPITLVAVSLSQSTQPMYAEASTSSHRRSEAARTATGQVMVTVAVAGAIAVVGPPALRMILPESYAAAGEYIPLLALGSALFGLYLIPMNAITVMAGRTSRVWMITVVAAALNIGLNIALVPRLGVMAAAVNTAVGYGALLIGVFLYMRTVAKPPIPYEISRIALGASTVAFASLVAILVAPSDPVGAALVGGAIVTCVAIGLMATLFSKEARAVLRTIRRPSDGATR